MKKMATLTGHSLRVLYLAMSPDGETIVTGAGDETLRFWKTFPRNNLRPAPYGANQQDTVMTEPNSKLSTLSMSLR